VKNIKMNIDIAKEEIDRIVNLDDTNDKIK
jgi:hypothetical protein